MELPKRKPTRLKNYDYSQNGAYFVTACTAEKKHILFRIVGEGMETLHYKIWEYIDTNVLRWEDDCFYNAI